MFLLQLITLSVLTQGVMGHIFMQSPPSRRNKYSNYYLSSGNVDYNIMAPLNTPGYVFPCKGFPKGPSTATFTSRSIPIVLEGTATHEGGHCQFGITYDGNTFLVLETIRSNCLLNGLSFTLNLPQNIPDGEVTLFWSWVNKIGNREYYMECADITLATGNSNKNVDLSGKELLVVNLPGYPTIPEFRLDGMYDGSDLLDARRDITIRPSNAEPVKTTTSEEPTTTTTTFKPITTEDPSATIGTTTTTTTFEPITTEDPSTIIGPTTSEDQVNTEESSSTTTRLQDSNEQFDRSITTTDGVCEGNNIKCVGNIVEICMHGSWLQRPCPDGYECKETSDVEAVCELISDC